MVCVYTYYVFRFDVEHQFFVSSKNYKHFILFILLVHKSLTKT